MTNAEEWRPIADAPQYDVSSLGRVRNRKRGLILALRHSAKGYVVVSLHERKTKRVNRLVCEAFNGSPPFPGAQAAHLDGTRDNNVPSNLAWATNKENSEHREMHGNTPRGERNGMAKLTSEEVAAIRLAVADGGNRREIAAMFNIAPSSLDKILGGRSWVIDNNQVQREPA